MGVPLQEPLLEVTLPPHTLSGHAPSEVLGSQVAPSHPRQPCRVASNRGSNLRRLLLAYQDLISPLLPQQGGASHKFHSQADMLISTKKVLQICSIPTCLVFHVLFFRLSQQQYHHQRTSLRENSKSKTLTAGMDPSSVCLSNSGSISSLVSAGISSPLLPSGGGVQRRSLRSAASGIRSEESSLVDQQSLGAMSSVRSQPINKSIDSRGEYSFQQRIKSRPAQ